jgi:hypothetical protein
MSTDPHHDALMAVARSLTPDETAAFLARLAPPGSRLHGAEVADLLDMLDQHDAWLDQIEPFYADNEHELPQVAGTRYALYALLGLGRELTVENLTRMLTAAGLLPKAAPARVQDRPATAGAGTLTAEARMAYDPIGDLAEVLAAVLYHAPAGITARDGRALARLRDGLGLRADQPAVPSAAAQEVEQAVRAALAAFTTRTGHLITTAEIEGWVAEADRGYDLEPAPPPHPELGPGSGHQANGPADCPRCQMIRDNAHWLALPEPDPQGRRWEDHEDF